MYDEEYEGAVVVRRPHQRHQRMNHLEERLLEQEKTTRTLIEKAFEFKEALSKDINPSSMDDTLQHLWHDHIRSVTSSVKRLSRDVEELKYQLAARDKGIVDTAYQTRNLEQFTQAGVVDLRGRVVRCDSLIARLAQDIRAANSNQEIEKKHVDQSTEAHRQRIDRLNSEIYELTRRLDAVMTMQDDKLDVVKGTSSSQLQAMNSKMMQIIEDIRLSIESNRRWSETERSRIENQTSQIIELNNTLVQNKQESFELRLMEKLDFLQRSINDCRGDVTKVRDEMNSKSDGSGRFNAMMEDFSRRIDRDMMKLRREYSESFNAVKESLDTTNRLINAKIKLLKDELAKEINGVRKMIVLL